jgi:hypothetical protein
MQRFGASERQALRIVSMSASLYRYRSVARDARGLKLRIKEITDTRVHYGYRRVHVLLRREGYKDNVKRVYRLYREAGLSLWLKRPRRNKAAKWRQPKQLVGDQRNLEHGFCGGCALRWPQVTQAYDGRSPTATIGATRYQFDLARNMQRRSEIVEQLIAQTKCSLLLRAYLLQSRSVRNGRRGNALIL